VVRLQVQDGVKFPNDSSARILTSGLLGDQFIGIEAGASETAFAPDETIKYTQSALVLESLIGQMLFNRAAEAGTSTPPAAGPAKK
jgi:phospholipid/cholesterol/gamma-HCH transport system substrate-binding protein